MGNDWRRQPDETGGYQAAFIVWVVLLSVLVLALIAFRHPAAPRPQAQILPPVATAPVTAPKPDSVLPPSPAPAPAPVDLSDGGPAPKVQDRFPPPPPPPPPMIETLPDPEITPAPEPGPSLDLPVSAPNHSHSHSRSGRHHRHHRRARHGHPGRTAARPCEPMECFFLGTARLGGLIP